MITVWYAEGMSFAEIEVVNFVDRTNKRVFVYHYIPEGKTEEKK